jgi:hypothetical protein
MALCLREGRGKDGGKGEKSEFFRHIRFFCQKKNRSSSPVPLKAAPTTPAPPTFYYPKGEKESKRVKKNRKKKKARKVRPKKRAHSPQLRSANHKED